MTFIPKPDPIKGELFKKVRKKRSDFGKKRIKKGYFMRLLEDIRKLFLL